MKYIKLSRPLQALILSGVISMISCPSTFAKNDNAPGQANKTDTTPPATTPPATTTTTTVVDTATSVVDKVTGQDKKNTDTTTTTTTTTSTTSNGNSNKGGSLILASQDANHPTIYHFASDFTMSSDVIISGHAMIVADGGFDFKNSELQLATGSTLTMYVKGDINLNGNGDIGTLSAPANLIIYGTGGVGQGIDVGGNAGISGVIYAPDADILFHGTSGILGAAIGKTIKNNGQGSGQKSFNGLNYDEALKDMVLNDDAMIMEDYGIIKANDSFQGNASNGDYAAFFSQF